MHRTLLISTLPAALFAAIFFAAPAHAQAVSVYATSANTRFSNVETGVAYSPFTATEEYTTFWASGIGGGVTFNFIPLGPVRLGFDLRGSTRRGTPGADTAMAGLRLGFKLPTIPLKPYVQASGGYVATRAPDVSTYAPGTPVSSTSSTFSNQYAAYEVFAGLDIPLVHFIDLRAVEVGAGQGFMVSTVNSSTPNLTLFSINSGIVLHF